MSLKDLTDQELRAYVKDPKGFVKEESNYKKIFDLDDDAFRKKVEKIRAELLQESGHKAEKWLSGS